MAAVNLSLSLSFAHPQYRFFLFNRPTLLHSTLHTHTHTLRSDYEQTGGGDVTRVQNAAAVVVAALPPSTTSNTRKVLCTLCMRHTHSHNHSLGCDVPRIDCNRLQPEKMWIEIKFGLTHCVMKV